MALNKKPTPKFEDVNDGQETATATAETQVKETAKAEPEAAKVEATTAIAKAASTSVSTNDAVNAAKAFKKEVEAMQGSADFSFGTHRVFKAKDGVIKEMSGEKVVLGKWAKVRMLAWDRHFEISPGEDGAASAMFVAYSRDGETIDNVVGEEQKSWEGKQVSDYIEYLRVTEEFDKANKREFIDVQVAVLTSEEEPDFSDIVQVTLSSSSIPAFKQYQGKLEATAKCVAMALPGFVLPEDPFTFYFVRENAEKGKNSWTKIAIKSTLPAKV